jgi:hypothetical protein
LRTNRLLRFERTQSGTSIAGFAAFRQHGGEFIQCLDADLRWAKAHAGAVAFVEHPVRQFARKIGRSSV